MRHGWWVALQLVACKAKDDDDSAPPASMEVAPLGDVTATIGAGGGTVAVDAFSLEIPPGALDADTVITVTAFGADGVGVYVLEPDGLVFATPAIARMPGDAAPGGPFGFGVLVSADGTEEWIAMTEDPADPSLDLAPIAHFSTLVDAGGLTVEGGLDVWGTFPRDATHQPSGSVGAGHHLVGEPFFPAAWVAVTGPLTGAYSPHVRFTDAASWTFEASEVTLTERTSAATAPVEAFPPAVSPLGLVVGPGQGAGLSAGFVCDAGGDGTATLDLTLEIAATTSTVTSMGFTSSANELLAQVFGTEDRPPPMKLRLRWVYQATCDGEIVPLWLSILEYLSEQNRFKEGLGTSPARSTATGRR